MNIISNIDFLDARVQYYRSRGESYSNAMEMAHHDCYMYDLTYQYRWLKDNTIVPRVHNYIIFKPLFDDISNLDQETLHASYVSLLAQHAQEQAMDSITLLKQEQEAYYHKYGRWYDKFITYLK
jgi:hypothetical protein